jgi:hypothetical protein
MRWAALIAAVLALAVAATAGDAAQRGGFSSTGCRSQSSAGFPHAFTLPDSLVVGPLAFRFALKEYSRDEIARFGGFKAPALLRPGHTARVSISRASRSTARLAYGATDGRTEADFPRFPHTIRFRSCSRRRAMSHVDGKRVTFWSGFFVLKPQPACVGVDISIDRRRARHRTIPVAGGTCP